MGRPKKVENLEENKIETKENKKQTKVKKDENNDMFSPENMAKMYAMFKQFQQMESEMKVEEKVNVEKVNKNNKFTKVMLSKIGNEEITIKSATENVIYISPKTQMKYKWLHKGDVEVMTISELLAMENASERFLHTPWLIVEDNRVIEALNLKKLYDNIKRVEDIDSLIKLDSEEIRQIFESLPNTYKNNFRDEIYIKVQNQELRDIVIIDTLSDILGINLKE